MSTTRLGFVGSSAAYAGGDVVLVEGPFIADRIKETTFTAGTGTITLLGSVAGFRSFGSVFDDGDRVYYAILAQTPGQWEVGIGTVGGSGTTLARTTVLSSSTGSLVNFSAGTKDVICDRPAAAGVSAGPFSTVSSITVQDGLITELIGS